MIGRDHEIATAPIVEQQQELDGRRAGAPLEIPVTSKVVIWSLTFQRLEALHSFQFTGMYEGESHEYSC
jgi:hypothetical protein